MKLPVRAAGGIVSRMSEHGRREVLIVYRAGHEDWTFPKGKRRRDEEDAACARREVEEETGLRCELGPELPPTTYSTRSGRPKSVRYWAMSVIGGRARAGREIDEVRWVDLEAVAALLTYARDRVLLAAFARLTRGRPAGRRGDGARRTQPVRGRGGRTRAA
jgi:8-oxo-dGTP pyrophosphatase MutT (NUDIX family)